MAIRREARRERFTNLCNKLIEDKRLSARGLGVLVYILSKPDHWEVFAKELVTRFGSGDITGRPEKRDAVYKIIEEHIELGYCRRVKARGTSGKFREVDYVYTDSPLPDYPDTANPDTANPDTAEPDTANPDVVNTECKQILNKVTTEVKDVCTELESSAPTPAVIQESLIDFPVNKKDQSWSLTQEFYGLLCETYPAVDVWAHLLKAKAWLVSNPSKRKTTRGMSAFLNNWMSREQDRGGRHERHQRTSASSYQAGKAAAAEAIWNAPGCESLDPEQYQSLFGDRPFQSDEHEEAAPDHLCLPVIGKD